MSSTTTRSWGIVTSVSGLQAGICVNSLDWSETVETGEARNEQGKITDLCGYSQKRTVTVNGVLDSAKGTLITAGSVLTLNSKDYLVTSVQKKESNTAFIEVTITAEGSDDSVITVIGSN